MDSNGFKRPHPLVLGAAASVMVVSLMAAASIGGLLPDARSGKTDMRTERSSVDARNPLRIESGATARGSICASCGTVESIRSMELKGDATGLGAVAGGATGAVIGNQMGRGHGNTAMTILAAAGGALVGNEIEKNAKRHYSYRVTIRMEDGSFRTISQPNAPGVAVGERVRIVDGAVVARS